MNVNIRLGNNESPQAAWMICTASWNRNDARSPTASMTTDSFFEPIGERIVPSDVTEREESISFVPHGFFTRMGGFPYYFFLLERLFVTIHRRNRTKQYHYL